MRKRRRLLLKLDGHRPSRSPLQARSLPGPETITLKSLLQVCKPSSLLFISFIMDIPSVGAHCALPSCNVNDFLPIKCTCEQVFCRAHISPDLHACPSLDAHSNFQPDSSSDPSKRLQRCAFETCNKPSLESFLSSETREDSSRSPAVCSRCSKAFCVT